MRIVVIGGAGHIGTYLVPRLVAAGHEVLVVSRGNRDPYTPHGAWRQVTKVALDREVEEAAGNFGAAIAELRPDVVVDLTCFNLAGAQQLVEALADRVRHFLHCGTIWVHGPSGQIPTSEDGPRRPITQYGEKKVAIEDFLHREAAIAGFPATVIHPGHITGAGWVPINPAGNINPEIFQTLADGQRLVLPNGGMETVQHVHADDVAGVFLAAIGQRAVSHGESFHAVANTAVTLRGYAEAVAEWFGTTAHLDYLPWPQWKETVSDRDAEVTASHLDHSPHCGMDKARRLLGFQPRFTGLEAVFDALSWMVRAGQIKRLEA